MSDGHPLFRQEQANNDRSLQLKQHTQQQRQPETTTTKQNKNKRQAMVWQRSRRSSPSPGRTTKVDDNARIMLVSLRSRPAQSWLGCPYIPIISTDRKWPLVVASRLQGMWMLYDMTEVTLAQHRHNTDIAQTQVQAQAAKYLHNQRRS